MKPNTCLLSTSALSIAMLVAPAAIAAEAPPAETQAAMKCYGPQDACQQLADLAKKYSAAFNRNDAAALAALYTQDAVIVGEGPMLSGKPAIENAFGELFKGGGWTDHAAPVLEVHVAGNMAWRIGQYSLTFPGPNHASQRGHGYWSTVNVLDNGTWKIREETWNAIEAPPASTGSVSASK